jgi:hypothetical protein
MNFAKVQILYEQKKSRFGDSGIIINILLVVFI